MSILDELWYGNITPCERDFKKGSAYAELLGYIVRHEEALQKRMNDEEKEILEKHRRDVRHRRAGSLCARVYARSKDHH